MLLTLSDNNLYEYNDYNEYNEYNEYNLIGGGSKKKWTTFIHNGVLFNPPYKKHDVPLIYQDKQIILSSKAEEMATLYAKLIDTEYINNSRFNRNFWKSWKTVLGDTEITDLANCNFKLINDYILKIRSQKLELSSEQKKQITEKKKHLLDNFKRALVDGRNEYVANVVVEPAGLFIGRGCHPKTGMFRHEILPEDVTLNLSKGTPIPKIFYISENNELVEMKDSRWGKIVNDNKSEWVASWKDEVTGKRKYVWLDNSSEFKSSSDIKKFDLARKLKKKIHHIRENIMGLLYSSDAKNSQLATAIYLIDKLALRVGNEKDEDQADTVGVTSLRVEHINFEGGKDTIVLDFLSKDSMRYFNQIQVHHQVYENLIKFTNNKQKSDPLFEYISSGDCNEYLQTLMKDLTAKCFRTFNASNTFQHKINKIYKKYPIDSQNIDKHEWTKEQLKDILDMFERANIEVAKLCNHQKKTVGSLKQQLDIIKDKINELKKKKRNIQSKKRTVTTTKRISKINDQIKLLKAKISLKNELKNISLSTSKINYIDPRIMVAFSKKMRIPIEKIYTSTLQKKFTWALSVDQEFHF
jgi:DNA topoisomerase-1